MDGLKKEYLLPRGISPSRRIERGAAQADVVSTCLRDVPTRWRVILPWSCALHFHLVRFGLPGYVGVFSTSDGSCFPRGARVICRTRRGLEVGEVLQTIPKASNSDGTLLRGVTVEDDLLLARLERDRDDAYRECCQLLRERQLDAVLMDVEQLFDGAAIYFYFLGDVTPELDALTGELAERYTARIQFDQFAESLEYGCGPDCGTESAAGGCGNGGCASCVVADACRKPS